MNLQIAILLVAGVLSLASVATAQNTSSANQPATDLPKKKAAKKKVFVSFEEDLVEGSMTGAELFLILQKKQTDFGSLFELRDNFTGEMYQDVEGMN